MGDVNWREKFIAADRKNKPKSDCKHPTLVPAWNLVWGPVNQNKAFSLYCTTCGIKRPGIASVVFDRDAVPESTYLELRDTFKRYNARLKADWSQKWFWLYGEYLKSPEWREKRAACFKRDNYTCQDCKKVPALHAHHGTYERVGNENIDDLISLCEECHADRHFMNDMKFIDFYKPDKVARYNAIRAKRGL